LGETALQQASLILDQVPSEICFGNHIKEVSSSIESFSSYSWSDRQLKQKKDFFFQFYSLVSDALAGYREQRGLVEQERIGDDLVQERVVGMRMSISCF